MADKKPAKEEKKDDKKEAGKEAPKDVGKEAKKDGAAQPAVEGAEGGEVAKPKSKKKLLIIAAGAILVLGLVAAFLLLGGKKHAEEEEGESKDSKKEEKKDEHGKDAKKDPKKDAKKDAKGGHGDKKGEESLSLPSDVKEIVYMDLKEFLVNLETGSNEVSFLKMSISLELPDEETKVVIENNLPRIRDIIQVYLRELKGSELKGSAGLQRLREELIFRINNTIKPRVIRNVLFKEILVQ
jgi:flagellar FliL protein